VIGDSLAKSRKKEKTMRSKILLALSGLALLTLGYSVFADETEGGRVAPGELVWHFASRAYINPQNGTGVFAGYFSDLQGVNGPMFDGVPSEATAHFTFLSDLIQFQNLDPDGGLNLTLLNTGTFSLYFNANPSGTWNDPTSFSQGQLIAVYRRTQVQLISAGPVVTSVFSARLVSSSDFNFGGRTYNLAKIWPNAIANWGTGSTSPLTGTGDFPIALADAGSAVAAGRP
jgi:hypothetical protein